MKKLLLSIVGLSLVLSGLFISNNAQAKDLSLRDLINLLILIEVIPKDKIPAINQFLASVGDSDSINETETEDENEDENDDLNISGDDIKLPNIAVEYENKLRGPSTYAEALKVCTAEGKRLPSWSEAISTKVNPNKILTTYGSTYGKSGNDQRFWTNQSCGLGTGHATSWKGLPDVVKNKSDIMAKDYWNNCSGQIEKHYYQCVISDDQNDDEDEEDVDSDFNLESESDDNQENHITYKVESDKNFDQLKFSLSCDGDLVVVGARGGLFCGEDVIINMNNLTKEYTFPVNFNIKSTSTAEAIIGMSVIGYMGEVKIGSDKDTLTIKEKKTIIDNGDNDDDEDRDDENEDESEEDDN